MMVRRSFCGFCQWALGAVVAVGVAAATTPAAAKFVYEFSGDINVRLGDRLERHWPDSTEPLEGVQLRVVRENSPTKGAVGSHGTTDANGHFHIQRKFARDRDGVLPGDKDIRFRVQARFRNDSLKVRRGGWARNNWFTIAEVQGQEGADFTLGTRTFNTNQGHDLSDDLAGDHAQVWWIYNAALDALGRRDVGFAKRVTVTYPHRNIAPVGDRSFAAFKIFMHGSDGPEDRGGLAVMLHELMHVWHVRYLNKNLSTKCLIDWFGHHSGPDNIFSNRCSGFQEGFAEAAAQALEARVFGARPPHAASRDQLANLDDTPIHNEGEAQRTDIGWETFFTFMVQDDEWTSFESVAENYCQPADVGIFEILSALKADGFNVSNATFSAAVADIEAHATGFASREADFYKAFGDPGEAPRAIHDNLCAPQNYGTFHAAAARPTEAWGQVASGVGGDPVVIAGPPSHHGGDPGVARLRQAGSDTFQIRFQEWDYRRRDHGDTAHVRERIPVMMTRHGRHTMPDGSTWEAGTFQLSDTGSYRRQSFQESFPGRPKLFLTVQSGNGGHTIMVRARDVDASGFEAALFEEEALMDGHVQEEVGYLAVHADGDTGRARIAGRSVGFRLDRVQLDDNWSSAAGVDLRLEEETSADSETGHVGERVDVLRLGGRVFAQIVSHNGGDTAALRQRPSESGAVATGRVRTDDDWSGASLPGSLSAPVVVAGPPSDNGGNPAVVRLRDVAGSGFRARIQEWDYRAREHGDRSHTTELIDYLAVEEGRHRMPDGSVWEAGTVTVDGTRDWSDVDFSSEFDAAPRVFVTVQTYNGTDAVTPRVRSVGRQGFQTALIEEESKNDGHVNETVGYLAVHSPSGSGTVPAAGGDAPYNVFHGELDDRPGRIGPLQLFAEEEKSDDSEIGHILEDVDVIVANGRSVAQIVSNHGNDPVALRRQ